MRHQERAIGGGGVDDHGIVPGHHAAVPLEPFARLRAERRLGIQGNEGLIGFISAVGDDQVVGLRHRFALQLLAPLLDRALLRRWLRSGVSGAEQLEITDQRRTFPRRLSSLGRLIDRHADTLESVLDRQAGFAAGFQQSRGVRTVATASVLSLCAGRGRKRQQRADGAGFCIDQRQPVTGGLADLGKRIVAAGIEQDDAGSCWAPMSAC